MTIFYNFNKVQRQLVELGNRVQILHKYYNKTEDEAKKMFDEMPPVITPRTNGWLNEEERWAIAFFTHSLPRKTNRPDCRLHYYDIASKFACSIPTVKRYSNYCGREIQ